MLSVQAKTTLVAYVILMMSFLVPLDEDKSFGKKIALIALMLIPIVLAVYTVNCLVTGSQGKFGLGCNVLAWINSISILLCCTLILLFNMSGKKLLVEEKFTDSAYMINKTYYLYNDTLMKYVKLSDGYTINHLKSDTTIPTTNSSDEGNEIYMVKVRPLTNDENESQLIYDNNDYYITLHRVNELYGNVNGYWGSRRLKSSLNGAVRASNNTRATSPNSSDDDDDDTHVYPFRFKFINSELSDNNFRIEHSSENGVASVGQLKENEDDGYYTYDTEGDIFSFRDAGDAYVPSGPNSQNIQSVIDEISAIQGTSGSSLTGELTYNFELDGSDSVKFCFESDTLESDENCHIFNTNN